MTSMTLTAGEKMNPVGSQFPFAFEVVSVHQVHPTLVIREHVGDFETMDREVRISVLAHALRVRGN